MNHFAKLFDRKFCVLFIVQQSGNLKKLCRCFIVVFVHGYGLGEQIISVLNLETWINVFGGDRWKTEDPAWRTESSSGT